MRQFTFLLLIVLPSSLFGQANVESAIAGAASSAAAPAAKGAGAAAKGVFESLRKTLAGANQGAPNAGQATAEEAKQQDSRGISDVPAVQSASPGDLRAVEPKDLSGIAVGMTRSELIEKYGPPALKTTESMDNDLVETYTYMQSKGAAVVLTLRNDKVASKSVAAKAAHPSVISLSGPAKPKTPN